MFKDEKLEIVIEEFSERLLFVVAAGKKFLVDFIFGLNVPLPGLESRANYYSLILLSLG